MQRVGSARQAPCAAKGREMDRGITVENPYASVNIPREQFQQSFIARYLRDEPSTIANPAAVERQTELANGWNSPAIPTDSSWSRPYNPYASLRMPNGDSSASFYTVTLQKPRQGQQRGAARRCGCCRCCSCCPKCCCVVS